MRRKVVIATGFVPISGHPRPPEVYAQSLQRLHAMEFPIGTFEHALDACWLWQAVQWRKVEPTIGVADNPGKNTLAYHCVQHQKLNWVVNAFWSFEADVVVYIDSGIFTVPGVTEEIIRDFMKKAVNERSIVIPGCWPADCRIDLYQPCWRFCGGLMVVPREQAMLFDALFRTEALLMLTEENYVTWEVNTLAAVERADGLPIFWYQADHNASMFTSYPETRAAA